MQNYLYGCLFMIAYTVMSVFNDSLAKILTSNISSEQIVFLRFAFGNISLLFIALYFKTSLKTKFLRSHIIRGSLLALGMIMYTKSLSILPLSINIVGCFTIPIIVSIMAHFILKENITKSIWHTVFGFIGVIIAFLSYLNIGQITYIFPLLSSMLLFATLDIMNKSLLNKQEETLTIMFYTALFTTLFTAPGAIHTWSNLNISTIIQTITLGIGGNLVFFFLLQSFKFAPVSHVQPYKYIELPMSFIVGYVLFNESLKINVIIGSIIILLSTSHAFYKNKKDK